ncbi:hypothetical protein GYMLUDRAFT_50220 [Collybiopsis luxurians FD-317 M1]|uniref:Uncharacterized protein n=1 Tax=Collybiopsis luxurians FD-317 M1 TaxID=944289 RepID=A0A0D0CB18_9AGAR|nr:hypothetical protein GYMLUDRAFT_50220 [Collybiopsis luxurians FD-317 M1]
MKKWTRIPKTLLPVEIPHSIKRTSQSPPSQERCAANKPVRTFKASPQTLTLPHSTIKPHNSPTSSYSYVRYSSTFPNVTVHSPIGSSFTWVLTAFSHPTVEPYCMPTHAHLHTSARAPQPAKSSHLFHPPANFLRHQIVMTQHMTQLPKGT